MDYDYEDVGEEEWPEGWPRDVKIDEAREELVKFFNEKAGEIFYMKKLGVLFERQFFHWITAKAVNELIEDGLLGKEEVPLAKATRVKFVFNKKLRYYKRQINEHVAVIREYSNPVIAIACGRQAEVLFFNALAGKGFVSKGENINECRGKKWTKTNHDLDYIMERDNVAYGCEVKNKWDYIDKEELDIKLEMCNFLGIKPLFIMRYSPKSYNYEIINSGGYAMIFVAQIYPFGQKQLVNRIVNVLGLPADCPRAIPEGIIDRFMRWHNKRVGREIQR